ncbi:unnamed protein product, partial [Didymodactylos carnosus]
MSRVRPSGTG